MRFQQRLTYANIVSTLCLVLLLIGGGTAYALGKNTVGSPQIINKSIKAKDLGKGSVATGKIKKGAVTGAKVKNGSLSGSDLHPRVPGMAVAGLTFGSSGIVEGWFNRAGGKPTVNHPATGIYHITIPGVDPKPNTGGIVVLTPIFFNGRTCQWWSSTSTNYIQVECLGNSGTHADTALSIAVLED